jgi:hypothetical protein
MRRRQSANPRGGTRPGAGKPSIYRPKEHVPMCIRVKTSSYAKLCAMRQYTDLSDGDVIESLIRFPPVVTFSRRPRGFRAQGTAKGHRFSFRISPLATKIVATWVRQQRVLVGDVIEALIEAVPPDRGFPTRPAPRPRGRKRRWHV